MHLKHFFLAICLLVSPLAVMAEEGDPIMQETMLIDVPTTAALDRYQASFLTRAYSHGTVMESVDFGVYPRINIGLSVAVHQLLGDSSSVKVLDPDFQAKWKIFDGNLYLPAIAIGYDGRRYGYGYEGYDYTYERHHNKQYLDKRKGGYLTMTREVFVPGLKATLGANMSDWDFDDIYFFSGAFYHITDTIGLMAEWDNIRKIRDSRFNLGARFYLHPALALDAAVRRIGRGNESERILQLRYVTNF